MLSKDKAFKYARIAKFIVGWGSHLYYWVYPGVMVATTGIFVGYVVGFLYPNFISGGIPVPSSWPWSPLLSRSLWHGSLRRARAHRPPSTWQSTLCRFRHCWCSAFSHLAIASTILPGAAGISTTTRSRWQPIPTSLRPTPRMAPSSAMRAAFPSHSLIRPANRFPSPSTIPTRMLAATC